MQRVWILSDSLYAQKEKLPPFRQAELVFVRDLKQLKVSLDGTERLVLLSSLSNLQAAEAEFGKKILATHLLPEASTIEQLNLSTRCILQKARLQHDLEAAEAIAWSGVAGGQYDDPSIEFLGQSVLDIFGCRSMESVQEAILRACARVAPTEEVHVVAHPEYASARILGRYQLAVPIQFQGVLKAHIYVRFPSDVTQEDRERVGEALLHLSDAVALAVERNHVITKAEETKAVWEASFDSVEDPVSILDENFHIIRANRAYGKCLGLGISHLPGREAELVPRAVLQSLSQTSSSEWELTRGTQHYRAFFDPIHGTHGAGRFVLRLHDVTKERALTEKILAKEQVVEMGILVGSVAHEINNPIAGILATSQLLLKDIPQGNSLYQDILNITESAERCRKIVQTMLSLVRKSDEEKKNIALGECIHSALGLLASESTRLHIKFLLNEKKDASQLLVHANRNRLLQVFFHLVQQSMNAIAERQKQEKLETAFVKISVHTRREELIVEIEDNGDPAKHDYEIESPVAFTVAQMILEEHGARYEFHRGTIVSNMQRIIFPALANSALLES